MRSHPPQVTGPLSICAARARPQCGHSNFAAILAPPRALLERARQLPDRGSCLLSSVRRPIGADRALPGRPSSASSSSGREPVRPKAR